MTSTLLEAHRGAHEKLDRLEMLAVADLLEKPKSHLGKVEQEHKALKRIEEMVDTSKQLLLMYEDSDGSRREELSSMAPGSTDRAFEAFYDRLKEMRAYYRRFPELSAANASMAEADSFDVQAHVAFSGEEGDGRYLDLHSMHDRYLNLRGVEPLDYIAYLDAFHRTDRIPVAVKHHAVYRDYVQALLDTLLYFFKRAMPFENIDAALGDVERKLAQERADRKSHAAAPPAAAHAAGPAAQAAPASELPAPSTDGSFFCEACQKPFAKDTVFLGHLKGKKHVKAAEELAKRKVSTSNGRVDAHDTELNERKIAFLGDYLSQVILNTKRNVEKRQSMTVEEKELNEANEMIADEIADDDDEPPEELDPKVWNPKGLPLDVTGKPIPYWLWKLHGLGVEYKCEICGGYSYWGIYAFEKHFNEWRHSNAMKILGIPNTKHFMNVTTINEAIALYHKLKQDGVKFSFNPQTEEEFEDRDGNVMPRKIYEDMMRQGLL